MIGWISIMDFENRYEGMERFTVQVGGPSISEKTERCETVEEIHKIIDGLLRAKEGGEDD